MNKMTASTFTIIINKVKWIITKSDDGFVVSTAKKSFHFRNNELFNVVINVLNNHS